MFLLSAFADEISPDPHEQIAVLKASRVRYIEFRSIYKTNVLALTNDQLRDFKTLITGEGIGLSAIGSPIGKYPIDQPFDPHFDKFKRAVDICYSFGIRGIRIFSYYPPGNDPNFDPANWPTYRDEVMNRMRKKAEFAATSGMVLYHENEHRIYGDSPDRVADILTTVNLPSLRAAYDAANYAYGNFDPIEGWEKAKKYVSHFHIKDWKKGGHAAGYDYGVIAGTGDGHLDYSIKAAVGMGYSGFATMEPHLRGGSPTGGVTGSDLFPYAVDAFRTILRNCGGTEG